MNTSYSRKTTPCKLNFAIFSMKFLRRSSSRNAPRYNENMARNDFEKHKKRMFSLLVSNTWSRNTVVQWMLVSSLVTTNDGGQWVHYVFHWTKGKRTKEESKSFNFNLCKTRNLVWPIEKLPRLWIFISSQNRHIINKFKFRKSTAVSSYRQIGWH